MSQQLNWTEKQQQHFALWISENSHKAPKNIILASNNLNADDAIALANANTGFIWQSDFHQAKQLLAAMKRRLQNTKKKAKVPDNIGERFHRHRMQQGQISRILSHLLVRVSPNFVLDLPRAPDIQAALTSAGIRTPEQDILIPLQALLGYIGAHEWYKQGVSILALDKHKIHVPFGVFSPLRGEYLDLLMQATLPTHAKVALDIGTGSGVLAAILAKKGMEKIIATDNSPIAIQTAKDNIERLGLSDQVTILEQEFFPNETADIIVCNPPWLPAKPSSTIETALYDPDSKMLLGVLQQAKEHLGPHGQLWIVMSDLAEHLGLRSTSFLEDAFTKHGWTVVNQLKTQAKHNKAQDSDDTLAFAREKEVTSLYILKRMPTNQ